MRLSDAVSALGMAVFPIVGLLLFVAVFISTAMRVAKARQSDMDHAARLPLESGEAAAAVGGQTP